MAACQRCALPLSAVDHGCWDERLPLATTTAPYRYRGIVADTVVAAKLRGLSSAWRPFGARLASAFTLLDGVQAVAYVPTEPRRARQRGFDHAALLAAGVADCLGLPLVPALAARRGAPDQGAAATVADRRRLPTGTFVATRRLDGAHLLLVDDVLTTGATVRAAVDALVDAGASSIELGVIARAGAHPLSAAEPDEPHPSVESSTERPLRDGRH